jgi:hypothetical protein
MATCSACLIRQRLATDAFRQVNLAASGGTIPGLLILAT